MNNGAFGENFPYTNFHDLNLDWIIQTIMENNKTIDEFVLHTQIHVEGVWDEHTAYTKYALVSDGTHFYLSMKDTPPGILLSNTDYWQKVVDNPVMHTEGNWASNRSYTHLSIVTAGNTGYVSKQDVPAGTLLSNTNYWQRMYDLTYPEGRKYVFIGDSYGAQTETWITPVINALELTEGVTAFRKARASYGFIGDTAHVDNPTFIRLLEEVYEEIDLPNTITDIVVCGGHNDAYGSDTQGLLTAINAFISRVYTLFPNAIIHIGFIAYTGTDTYANYAQTINMYQYGANQRRSEYMTETEKAIHSMYFLKDDLTHPNHYGALEIANAIIRCLNTGSCSNRIHVPFATYLTASGLSENATFGDNRLFTEDGTTISGSVRLTGNFPADARPTWQCSDSFQEIASFDPKQSWVFGQTQELTFEGTLHIYNGSNYYRIPATFTFYHGKLWASFPAKVENSTTDLSLTVYQFKINRVGFNLPYLGT